jgi:hypothetical protein
MCFFLLSFFFCFYEKCETDGYRKNAICFWLNNREISIIEKKRKEKKKAEYNYTPQPYSLLDIPPAALPKSLGLDLPDLV